VPGPRTLIATDFGFPGLKTASVNSKSATGTLAAPWRDTSAWGGVWASYALKHEGGRRFQRLHVSRLRDGRGQMACLLPRLGLVSSLVERTYTVEVSVKGTPGLSVFLGVRQQEAPWDYAWANAVVLSSAWRSIQWTFRLPQTEQPLMLLFEVPREGTLDIARVKLQERFSSAL
jgi:hypothetical protein